MVSLKSNIFREGSFVLKFREFLGFVGFPGKFRELLGFWSAAAFLVKILGISGVLICRGI